MFTPSPNQGFSPEWGAGVPQIPPQNLVFQTTQPREANWEAQMAIEWGVNQLVPDTISRSTADWLIQEALKDERQAEQLIHRLVRPEGFDGTKNSF